MKGVQKLEIWPLCPNLTGTGSCKIFAHLDQRKSQRWPVRHWHWWNESLGSPLSPCGQHTWDGSPFPCKCCIDQCSLQRSFPFSFAGRWQEELCDIWDRGGMWAPEQLHPGQTTWEMLAFAHQHLALKPAVVPDVVCEIITLTLPGTRFLCCTVSIQSGGQSPRPRSVEGKEGAMPRASFHYWNLSLLF